MEVDVFASKWMALAGSTLCTYLLKLFHEGDAACWFERLALLQPAMDGGGYSHITGGCVTHLSWLCHTWATSVSAYCCTFPLHAFCASAVWLWQRFLLLRLMTNAVLRTELYIHISMCQYWTHTCNN